MRGKLQNYVRQGGTLVLNVLQVAKSDGEWLGVKLTRATGKADSSRDLRSGESFQERPFTYAVCRGDGAEVRAESGDGSPLIFERKLGKGRVILTTPHYLQADDALDLDEETMGSRMLRIGLSLVDDLHQRHRMVKISGPAVQEAS